VVRDRLSDRVIESYSPVPAPRRRLSGSNVTFEPQIVRKEQQRFEGFDDRILALYSRGLSTRDIEAHLAEIYGVKVGRDLISRVTDAVMDDVRDWQQGPLDDVYPVLFVDALVLKIREGGTVQRSGGSRPPACVDSSCRREPDLKSAVHRGREGSTPSARTTNLLLTRATLPAPEPARAHLAHTAAAPA
jgi:hypothetical protein